MFPVVLIVNHLLEGRTNMALTVGSKEEKVGVFRVSPAGSLDTNTYTILEKKIASLTEVKPKAIIFDFQDLEYISSAGIRVIMKTKKAMKKSGGTTAFLNMQAPIQKVFDIINLLPSMNVFASVQELDAYLDKMQKDCEEDEF
jgi:anti-sigma B factor antagonist